MPSSREFTLILQQSLGLHQGYNAPNFMQNWQ